MAKVSKDCMKLIEGLPDTDVNELKQKCLTKSSRAKRPLTPKQKAWNQKFTACANKSRGRPDYRQSMKECLQSS